MRVAFFHRWSAAGVALGLGLGLGLALFAARPALAFEVAPTRPRLLLRADAADMGRGPTVSEVRRRRTHPDLAPYAKLATSDTSWESILTPALQTLLGGDPTARAQVRTWMLEQTAASKRSVARQAPGHLAIAFDWLHAELSTDDRRMIADNIQTGADAALAFLHVGRPDIVHNFTYMALFSVTMAGLALHAEPGYEAVSQAYLEEAADWLAGPGGVYDACAALGGAFPEGGQYSLTESTRLLVLTLQGLRTATRDDPFAEIRARRGDFLRGTARFYMAITRPDLTVERIGDMNQAKPLLRDQHRFVLEALAAGLRGDGGDAAVPAMLEHFGDLVHGAYGWRDTHRNFAWGMLVFADPEARRDPAAYATQPLAQIFGRGTLDCVVFRHGWDENGTMITFQGGDHFTDHQHFDKGAFTIYHRGALAIDSGAYDRMYSAHHSQYACRTVAHSAPLVFDPEQPLPPRFTRDGGQRVLRGFQHHARWTDVVQHRERENLDTADVKHVEGGRATPIATTGAALHADFSSYAVVQSELAPAYGPAVRSLVRTLAYWPAAQVVLVDDAFDLAKPLDVAFTLHTQQPILPALPAADTTGASTAPGNTSFGSVAWWVTSRRGAIDLGEREISYDGRLFLRTLAPAGHRDRRIGGVGFEWWTGGTNYGPAGNGALPRESGTWRIEVGPSQPGTTHRLTHAIGVGDATMQRAMDAAVVPASTGWRAAHVASAPEAVLVLADGGRASLPLRYELATALPSVHVVVGLPAGASFDVRTGESRRSVQVGPEGILAFLDVEVGRHSVQVTGSIP